MDKRIVRTKKAIYHAYVSLLHEKNGSKIMVSEVAKRAGIDRKTFYLHYHSVQDIIGDFIQSFVEELHTRIRKTNFESDPNRISILFEVINSLIADDIDFYRLLASVPSSSMYEPFYKHIVNSLYKSYEDESTLSKAQLYTVIDFCVSGVIGAYRNWLTSDSAVTLDEIAESIKFILNYPKIRNIFSVTQPVSNN